MKKRLFRLIALVALLGVGLFAIATPIAHAAPPTSHTVIRTSGTEADAAFSFTQGDVIGAVNVSASLQGFQTEPPTISGPAVAVSLSECNIVTEECLFGSGQAPAPGLQIDTKKLTSATLPEVTVQVTPVDKSGAPTGQSFPVTVAFTWTGVGSITTQSSISHYRVGHEFSAMFRFKGTFRNATVSGTASYPSPLGGSTITLTGADSVFAQMMSSGSMDISIQR